MTINRPRHVAVGMGVVLLGLPVYHLVFARMQVRTGAWCEAQLAGPAPTLTSPEKT
jgi:hypothetical protein